MGFIHVHVCSHTHTRLSFWYFQLIDQIEPLTRTMSRKQRKTIGWSQNLIQNCSAEVKTDIYIIIYMYLLSIYLLRIHI